ncbi:glutamine--fructose-6-phosphate transaminase (isomerizing) [Rhodococcus erythropolis]|jgi:glucosamine--fructose-6-phosphate aminotransferase (isomerizing)|uniref:Glutamine--fructose-6-phosphate aminotransferase [isomerizing] n=1 Tax=Rhodococcus erythropolis (strain PR4 / NBRC 100887) TaxID=234621 RepID=C0ZW84_RHOE4|nr:MULTISPECIES: glutamine--fructose-6-phosphate transaminase (isomerizing) [Rhodococcus]ATI34017.1 glutamine--fructose-6-phosphate transaminase (isomerizing) [Rhodococcus sp. H-CA8f]MBO8147124.1 glutamine--fructose-6-phosphate transaminase (isomerizing) [Rhodococcus erythropolis]MDI9906992.1 glutamine--fructose-6-phosphate transaminase (isomerizing) [Rhodococcus sp. IEGM 1406]MDJ0014316.1 glutamine--fructose-6-phosphate transaminase (isomerizing) [Rhodococcus erythropolis]MDJ0490473.1 glutami
MCGIVGYVGHRPALGVVVEALRRMEYRGYDSSGIAILDGTGGVEIERKAGKLANLEAELGEYGADHFVGTSGMGHTRWATHGRPTDRNAHPHRDASGKLAVVHNGIIENFAPLRAELEAAGVELQSDTDSEVAVHLVARAYSHGPTAGDFIESALSVVRRLEGAFTLVFTHADHADTIVAARRSTPLVVGVGEGEMFLGSDVAAFIEHTRDAVELGQDQAVVITADSYRISDFAGNEAEGRPFRIDWDLAAAEKGGHDYFMLKEIEEQPTAVADTLLGHFENGKIVLDEQRLSDQELRDVDKVFVVACGSAYHSGLLAKYAIEHWTRLPVEVELASEFRYRDPVLDRSTLVVAISQSGETADTLEAVKHAKDQKARVLAICNTNGAQIPREADAVLYTRAGPEIAVASTKAFLAQVTANYLVGLALAQARGTKYPDEVAREYADLEAMPALVSKVLETAEPVRALARQFAHASTVLFLGRHVGYPVALEGALKLKELAYMHAEGFAAGELKHGPIALIEEDLPVIIVMPSPQGRAVLHSKLVSNIQEIKARGATTIVIAEEGDTVAAAHADHLIEIPASPTLLQPLLSTVPLQIFAAEVAAARGYDVDKPRNLAKSVTVE